MINREITYERTVNKSYMKIPAVIEACLDEKLIFRKPYQGILPMEKCYVNGMGQYWYNITGRQALDAYCRVNAINQGFFETLILRICSQVEILEWNLIDTSCLIIDPELIFVNSSGEDISFVLYPDTKANFFDELQQLMEYLLTKLNHSDKDGVHHVYDIYNMAFSGGYSISDLKQAILNKRLPKEKIGEEETPILQYTYTSLEKEQEREEEESVKEDIFQEIEKKMIQFVDNIKKRMSNKKETKEEVPMVVYPEEELEEENEITINPTVCLAATLGMPKGVLVHEGMGDYPDFEIGEESCILGKNPKVKLYLNRETISQFHAKFDYFDKKYYIEDLNSTNGTFINDEMLNYKEKRMLEPGDVLRFADVKYRFL